MQNPGSSSIIPTVRMHMTQHTISQDFTGSGTDRLQGSMHTGRATGIDWITVLGHLGIYKSLVSTVKTSPTSSPILKIRGVSCNILRYCSAVWCVPRELSFSINAKNYSGTLSVRISKYKLFTPKTIKIVVDNSHKSSHQKTRYDCLKSLRKHENSKSRWIKHLQPLTWPCLNSFWVTTTRMFGKPWI